MQCQTSGPRPCFCTGYHFYSFNLFTVISNLNAYNKKKVFFHSTAALRLIRIPPELENEFELLVRHVAYSKILSKHSITSKDLAFVDKEIFEVRRKASAYYSEPNQGKKKKNSNKIWITINSHYMTHASLYVRRFGVLRNTWVFLFESALGKVKRYQLRHRNGKSEGTCFLYNGSITI